MVSMSDWWSIDSGIKSYRRGFDVLLFLIILLDELEFSYSKEQKLNYCFFNGWESEILITYFITTPHTYVSKTVW